MSSILKETESSVLSAATPSVPTAVSGTPVAKSSAEEQSRPQPVALEIPVTVNGARTVEGSDKREPFSETTKTVLVFGHGAVVRVSSSLAAGQLVFLTNEKTKKEVVCQVVKSKNQGSANGYVELQFTESAPGYWGMRFPASNSAPAAVAAPRPVAPASVKPVASAPAVVSPAIVAPAMIAPVEQEKVARPAVVAEAPVIEVAKTAEISRAKVFLEKPDAKTESVVTKTEELPTQPVAPAKIAIVENPSLDDLAKQLTKELLQGSAKELPKEPLKARPEEAAEVFLKEAAKEVPVNVPAPEAKAPAVSLNEPTSEELKQKAVQLQAELSSLLFENASNKKSDSTALVNQSHSLTPLPSVAEQKPEPTLPETSPVQALSSRPSSLLQKPLGQSIAVEEVKIPSWLAPLARETDFRSLESGHADTTKAEAATDLLKDKDEVAISDTAAEDAPREQQTIMFGGQLITDAPDAAQGSTGSKKGLWMGIAAAALLAGGGVWYANQPDNLLTGIFTSKPVAVPKSAAVTTNQSSSTPFRNEVSQPAETGHTSPTAAANNTPANSNPAIPIPGTNSKNSAAVVSFPASKNAVPTPAAAPLKAEAAPEQPKKPIFGGAHLAAPSVKRADGSVNANDAEPTIENSAPDTASASLNALTGNHSRGPAIPLAVGGEVKQARLLKPVPPVYPPSAKTQHVSGDVKLDALIDANGKVTSTKVISGPVLLHQAAMDAVKQWQYDPAQLNGKATSMHLTVTVQFRLQ
jgi:TonB family protein